MNKIRIRQIIMFILFITLILFELSFAKNNHLSKINSPKRIFENALDPVACLDFQGNVICSGIYWVTSYPQIAQKVDPKGNLLWPNEEYGILVTFPNSNEGDETSRPLHILPKEDGGAFFAYEYMDFLGRDPLEPLLKYYFIGPVLQSVSPDGEIQWAKEGIDLTKLNVRWIGGVDLLGLRYDNEGNVMVFWRWIDIDSLSWPNIEATYLQKVDPVTGELLLDSTGTKLLDERASEVLFSNCGNTYLFHRPWVLCINESGEIAWDIDLMTNITVPAFHAATNDSGDIFIIYQKNDGIYGSLFNRDGEPAWQDILIVPGEMKFRANSPFVNWNNDKWVFNTDNHIHCINKEGNSLWGDNGAVVNDTGFTLIYDVNPVDANNLMLVYDYYPGPGLSLRVQKINLNGDILWGDFGIAIMEKIGTVAHLLPDSEGGAYIVIDGVAIYEPEYRPRGTFIEKIDKDGNLGYITSVNAGHPENIPEDFYLINNYPNPFGDMTTISITTRPEYFTNSFSIVIYNLLGKEVRRFKVKNNSTNPVQIKWDGKDQSGTEVTAGVYFYRIGNKDKWFAAGKLTYLKGF
jgi:hypothetical protein